MRIGPALLLALLLATPAVAQERPNVVLVITDDQGYGDLSCHGNPVLKTPNMDKLYRQSVRLADYHVSPTCSPTRAALLTGRWTNRTGVWHTIMGRSLLRADEVTIARMFAQAGYATGMFGKWHLGDNYPYRAEDRGFAEVLRHGGGGVGQTPDYWDNAYFNGSYFFDSRATPVTGFCSDVWFDYAKRFIARQTAAGSPFFAYIATNAPHGPMHAPPEDSRPYEQQGTRLANFYGMIANIDSNLGELRDFLAEQQLTDNTIFIFTTDNGTAAGEAVHNAGMRGKKGSEYDGGHRVPFFFYWPAGGLTGGRDIEPITAHVDVLPTLLDLCDIEAPGNVQFDGRSLRPLLESNAADWPDRVLVTDSQRVKDPIKWRKSAVMTSRWRLINGRELYDMQHDPAQQTDVSSSQPKATQRLRGFYEDWWDELAPTFAENCPIYLGHPAEDPATLTCHDWITEGSSPWNQATIRSAARGPDVTGHWIVRVVEDGDYEIQLRRWPAEANVGIDQGLPAGSPVPGDRAFRARPGQAVSIVRASLRIGDQSQEQAVPKGASSVTFRMRLSRGDTELHARFHTSDSETLGAYYAYVTRRGESE